MTAYCSNCGSQLPAAARFCSVCGTAIAGPSASPSSGIPTPGFPPYSPRLVRPLFGRQIAGVCAALSRAYGWDLGVVRGVAVVAGVFLCPIPEIAYVAFWIGLPQEPVSSTPMNQVTNIPPQA